jgi:hypothetical protein
VKNIILHITIGLASILFAQKVFAQKIYINEMGPNTVQAGNIINPAHLLKTSGSEFSVVPLANFHFDVNMPYAFNDIFSLNKEGLNYMIDLKKMTANTGSNKYFLFRSGFDWIHFSGKKDDAVWRFAIEEKLTAASGFHNNFLHMIYGGNMKFLGQEYAMGLSLGEIHVRSINFTWSQPLNEKIDAGITAKFYSGRSLFTLQSGVYLHTQEKMEYIDMGISGKGKSSVPILLNQITGHDGNTIQFLNYLFGIRNPGLGFDLGINYKVNENIQLSASINDLGFIYWNRNTTTFTADGEYRWNGIDISEPINLGTVKYLRESNSLVAFRDSFLNGLFQPYNDSYFTNSPISFNAGGSFKIDNKLSFATTIETYYFSNFNKFNLTFASIFTPWKSFSLTSGLMFSNRAFLSIPISLAFNGKLINASISTYNTIGLLLPQSTKYFGGHINLSFNLSRLKIPKAQTHESIPFFNKIND